MEIDLKRHGVIEASAGTGKTYTVEQLVLRLLIETDVRLEEILLVTYTEKATGELKGRIRLALEQGPAERPEHRGRLQAALDAFDCRGRTAPRHGHGGGHDQRTHDGDASSHGALLTGRRRRAGAFRPERAIAASSVPR